MQIEFDTEGEHICIKIKNGKYDYSETIPDSNEVIPDVILNLDEADNLLSIELLSSNGVDFDLIAEKYNVPELKKIAPGLFRQIYQSLNSEHKELITK